MPLAFVSRRPGEDFRAGEAMRMLSNLKLIANNRLESSYLNYHRKASCKLYSHTGHVYRKGTILYVVCSLCTFCTLYTMQVFRDAKK